MQAEEISALEAALGYHFERRDLLERALTHSSHAHESAEAEADAAEVRDNEQLEFLGDAVLGFVTSESLFQRFPHYPEGHLSKMRAHLVSARHLVQVAKQFDLGAYLLLGKGEEKSGGRAKSALLANALEALLAAICLDGGLEPARRLIVERIVDPELQRLQQESSSGLPVSDFKSALQEFLQGSGRPQPAYTVIKEQGPEHKKTFTVEVRVHPPAGEGGGAYVSQAEGPTKKRAEQRAAQKALEELRSPQAKEKP